MVGTEPSPLAGQTGYGIAGLPGGTNDYLGTGISTAAGTLPPLNCIN